MKGGAEFRRHLEAFAEFVFIAASSGSGDVMKSYEAWKHFIKSASFKEAIENFPENSVKAIPESAKTATVAEIRKDTHVPGWHEPQSYLHIRDSLKGLPTTFYPDLLRTVVEEAERAKVFKPGGCMIFVQGCLDKIKEIQ